VRVWRRRPDFRPLAVVRKMPSAATTQEAPAPRSTTQKPVVVSQHTEVLHSAQSLAPTARSWYKECARWFVRPSGRDAVGTAPQGSYRIPRLSCFVHPPPSLATTSRSGRARPSAETIGHHNGEIGLSAGTCDRPDLMRRVTSGTWIPPRHKSASGKIKSRLWNKGLH